MSFAALAVLLAAGSHGEPPLHQLLTLLVTTAGMAAAILLADLVSHVVVHDRMMNSAELLHAVRASTIGIAVIAAPTALLGAAALSWLDSALAQRLAVAALAASMVAIGAFAVRGTRLNRWQRLLVLLAGAALGIGVITIEYLAHA